MAAAALIRESRISVELYWLLITKEFSVPSFSYSPSDSHGMGSMGAVAVAHEPDPVGQMLARALDTDVYSGAPVRVLLPHQL